MSFTTDITLTNGVANDRIVSSISVQNQSTLRRDADFGLVEPFTMNISHTTQSDGSFRHLVRLDSTKIYDVETAAKDQTSVYFVIVQPASSDQVTEIEWQVDAIADFLTAAGNLTKLLNGES